MSTPSNGSKSCKTCAKACLMSSLGSISCEGYDLPEVSLVAILDADKEGFLRSNRSLTQTVGRGRTQRKSHYVCRHRDPFHAGKRLTAPTTVATSKSAYNTTHKQVPKALNKSLDNALSTNSVATYAQEKERSAKPQKKPAATSPNHKLSNASATCVRPWKSPPKNSTLSKPPAYGTKSKAYKRSYKSFLFIK